MYETAAEAYLNRLRCLVFTMLLPHHQSPTGATTTWSWTRSARCRPMCSWGSSRACTSQPCTCLTGVCKTPRFAAHKCTLMQLPTQNLRHLCMLCIASRAPSCDFFVFVVCTSSAWLGKAPTPDLSLAAAAALLLETGDVSCCPAFNREIEGPPPDDCAESDEDAVQQHHQQQELAGSPSYAHRGGTFSSSGTHDPLGDLTWPLESSKTVSRGASSQLLSISQGVSSSAAAAAAAAATAAGAGISCLLAGANRGKSAERQRALTAVSGLWQVPHAVCGLETFLRCIRH